MNKWLNNAVFYQIYPTSFYDSNNDGIGDLNGVTQKVNYLKNLGVNAIWINPFYDSPFMDGGYDISDYYSIKSCFGTIEDFKKLVETYHQNNIKVVIDLVIGHTSDKHPWFIKSASEERNEYSDYYIWTDSIFKAYKNKTIQGIYSRDGGYYANYYACQPSLNFGFNNPTESWQMKYDDPRLAPLRNEIIKVMKYWLSFGIDGFRVDMANSLVKDPHFDSLDPKDNEGNIWLWNKLMSSVKKDYPECVFIAEWINPSISIPYCGFDVDFYAHNTEEFNELVRFEKGTNLLPDFERGENYFSCGSKGLFTNFEKRYLMDLASIGNKGAIGLASGNHDEIRLREKLTDDDLKDYFAFLLLSKNVPFIYYGDEIGMSHNFNLSKDGGFIRTGARTPMEWDNTKNSGFTKSSTPYLPTNGETNVEMQTQDPASLLNAVKELIKVKKDNCVFDASAEIKFIRDDKVLIFSRSNKNDLVYVTINTSNESYELPCDIKEVLYSYKKEDNIILPNGIIVYR